MCELVLQPLVSFRVQVLVAPQGGEAAAIREAHLLADFVVALVMRASNDPRDGLGRGRRGVESPRRVEVVGDALHQRHGCTEFHARPARDARM